MSSGAERLNFALSVADPIKERMRKRRLPRSGTGCEFRRAIGDRYTRAIGDQILVLSGTEIGVKALARNAFPTS